MKPVSIFLVAFIASLSMTAHAQRQLSADVLVIGGGTSGTSAGIQSARMGVRTLIVEPTPWLGGMISAAGVSAIDGNHRLPSGIWAEFREQLYKVYGGPAKVETGWVSNTLFEPHVADSIFKSMARKEKDLSVLHGFSFQSLTTWNNKITRVLFRNPKTGERISVTAKIFVDATELGDVLAAAGEGYDVGMEANSITGENVGVEKSSDIIQDLTYVAVLKDYGKNADCTIVRPKNYRPEEFDGSSTDYYRDTTRRKPNVAGKKMLDYGRLPHNKFMINWPIYGNDTYLNIIGQTEEQRLQSLEAAKEQTYRFVYFIQQQLGFKNLGLADDEFPTADRLALIPYHRESRRAHGLVRFTMKHLAEPFTHEPLYRTGISVGDYPIDHHHKKNPEAPQHLEFYPVPSYNLPLGALIPKKTANLVVAEKSTSVSNVVNGTTRLQPVVLLTGQAAGTLAALAVRNNNQPAQVPVRAVQKQLLDAGAYIMPYIDVTPAHPHFTAIQKIGATGLLKGTGVPYKWANQTWFYPDSLVKTADFAAGWKDFGGQQLQAAGEHLTLDEALQAIYAYQRQSSKSKAALTPYARFVTQVEKNWPGWKLSSFDQHKKITRTELSVLLDAHLKPFETQAVNHQGYFMKANKKPSFSH